MSGQSGDIIQCFCNKDMGLMHDERALIKHISSCEVFKNESPLAREFNQIPIDQLDFEPLYILRAELLSYLIQLEKNIIQQKGVIRKPIELFILQNQSSVQQQAADNKPIAPLKKNQMHIESINGQLVTGNNQQKPNAAAQNSNGNTAKKDRQAESNLERMSSQPEEIDMIALYSRASKTECLGCKVSYDSELDFDKLWFLSNCLHVYCKKCLNKQINEEYIAKKGSLKCKTCTSSIDSVDVQSILGKEKLEKFDMQLCEAICDFVECLKCKQTFDFQPGDTSSLVQGKDGKPLNQVQLNHYSFNRFVCPSAACRTEQCRQCKSIPYHLGYECQQFKSFQDSKRCRYCNEEISGQQKKRKEKAFEDICHEKECESKRKHACAQVLECGHGCCGVKDEIKCLPCLQENCAKDNDQLMGVTGDEYCNICFVEGLINAPVIRSKCGHMFHYHCLKKKLDIKWLSPRIVFNFCLCPLCKAWLDLPPDSDLYEALEIHRKLFLLIQDKAMKRLKHEEREKDEKLTKKDSGYYNKPIEYAMAIYSYYMCFKCKDPYFGGLKDCERALNDDKKEYKPSDLICPNCCDIPIAKCKKHGDDFIEFKCRYCCSIAVWFCFGTTHFCEPCHNNVSQLQKTPVNKLPACKKDKGCPFKGEHNPNGQETSLGCSICRNIKQQASDF